MQPRLPQLQQNEQQAKLGRANPKLDEHYYMVYTSVSGLIALLQKAWLVQWLLDSEAAAQYIWRTPPSWQSTLVAYWCILLMYDVIYYWFHRSFLHSRFGFSHVHCFHHQLSTPRSLLDAVYLHPIEAFVGMWLLYLPLVLMTRLGLPVHISAVGMWEASIALMVIYHSGMDVPWPSTPLDDALGVRRYEMNKSPVFSIAAHDLHHSDARVQLRAIHAVGGRCVWDRRSRGQLQQKTMSGASDSFGSGFIGGRNFYRAVLLLGRC